MLLQCTGLNTSSQQLKEICAFPTVVDITDGLPIVISAIGSRATFMIEEVGVYPAEIWTAVLHRYEERELLLSDLVLHHDKKEEIINVLLTSLDMIDNGTKDHISRTRFAKLGILQKREHVPFGGLERIWGLPENKTISQIEVFLRFNII